MFTYLLNSGDQDVINHISRMTSTNETVITAVSNLILGLKYDALWGKIGILCVAHDVEVDSLLNLKEPSSFAPNSVAINSPTFTANRGFLTIYNSTAADAAYINLLVTENSASLYELYDAHVMIYLRTFNHVDDLSGGPSYYLMGIGGTVAGTPSLSIIGADERQTPDDIILANLHASSGILRISQNVPIGCFIGSITSDSNRLSRLNDTTASDATTRTTAGLETNVNRFMKIGRTADASDGALEPGDQFAAWGIGGGLTAAEMALYEDRIRTYMQAIGADVY